MPFMMEYVVYTDCCDEWKCHLTSGYLRYNIANLTVQEEIKCIFEQQPMPISASM